MTDPLVLVLFTLVALVLSAVRGHRHAGLILALGGVLFLAVVSPASVVILLASIALSALLFLTARKLPRTHHWRKYGPYSVLILLLSVDFNEMVVGFPVASVGVSFALIRVFMTIKESLASRKEPQASHLVQVFIAAFYLPALPVGPVFSGLSLGKERPQIDRLHAFRHFRLIVLGLLLVSLFAPFIGAEAELYRGFSLAGFTTIPVRLFLQLFFAFWGQSLIAENFAPLFGHRIPVNFDAPWMARDIRDFWARWHRSMANFVMTYIFLPLQVNGVAPRLATVLAFIFMGLWHNISPGYFLWGLCHGLLLAFWPKWDWQALGWPTRLASRGFTVVAVIALSYLANYAQLEAWL